MTDGCFRLFPIGRVVGGWTPDDLLLAECIDHRVLIHGAESVTGNECAIFVAKKGNVSGGVTGSLEDVPAFHAGDLVVGIEFLKSSGEVGLFDWGEANNLCHKSADGWIGRRIGGASVEIRMLER